MPRPSALILIITLSTAMHALAGAAFAQTIQSREGSGQIPQDRLQPLQTNQDYETPGKIPDFGDILKNVHGSYSVSFMGPRLTGSTDETYNIYLPDKAPLQLYHTAKIGYQVSSDLQIGIDQAIVNNITENIQGFNYDTNGNAVIPHRYGKSFEYYDPNIYFNLPNLMKVEGWNVFTTASFSLPLTQASNDVKRITQLIITQAWTKKTYPSDWSWGFHLYLNPQFYADPKPDGYPTRETFSFSFGHTLSYRVSDLFDLSTSTTFDIEHDAPDPKGSLHFGEGLPDYFQIKATLHPDIYPLWMSISGYFQCLFWNPSWDTAIIGAAFSIGF